MHHAIISFFPSALSQTVEAFFSALQTSPLPVIDWRGEGIDVHARKDKLQESLTVSGYNNLTDYTGPNGIRRLVDDFRFRFVEYQYTLAGFKAPGTQGSDVS